MCLAKFLFFWYNTLSTSIVNLLKETKRSPSPPPPKKNQLAYQWLEHARWFQICLLLTVQSKHLLGLAKVPCAGQVGSQAPRKVHLHHFASRLASAQTCGGLAAPALKPRGREVRPALWVRHRDSRRAARGGMGRGDRQNGARVGGERSGLRTAQPREGNRALSPDGFDLTAQSCVANSGGAALSCSIRLLPATWEEGNIFPFHQVVCQQIQALSWIRCRRIGLLIPAQDLDCTLNERKVSHSFLTKAKQLYTTLLPPNNLVTSTWESNT